MGTLQGPRVVSLGDGCRDEFDWGAIEWLANSALLAGSAMSFGHVVLQAGAANPRHYHPNCQELLFVLEGSVDHEVGGQTVELGSGALLHIPQGTAHQARARDRGAVMVVVYSTEQRETVWVEDAP